MKYEAPMIEIVRFTLKTAILAASNTNTEITVESPTQAGTLPPDEEDPFGP